MLRALADEAKPGVAILLTGDGAGYDNGIGYHADLERLHKKGWGTEVLSWDAACRRALKTWATKVGVFVPLDPYYESVTYVKGGRKLKPLSLVHRQYATPHDPAQSAKAAKS